MFSMSQCFSIFFNFVYIFGQKGRLNFNFRANFTLFIKNRKPNMGLDICFLWAIWKCWQYLKKLQHWNQHWNIQNIEFNPMLKFRKTLTSHRVSMFIFLTSKTLNRNQCQCWCRPLFYTSSDIRKVIFMGLFRRWRG